MPTLAQRYRDWRGPSKAELQASITHLQTIVGKRFHPVASGVPINWNKFEYEQTQALKGAGKWDQYDRLALDPHVKGALRAIALPLVNADWEIQPASEEPRDEEIAEFVSANLLRKGGDKYGPEFYLRTPWASTRLREVLDMLESGFSMFAKTTKIVNGKRIYDRLQWLEPSSVDPAGWVLNDHDEIVEIKRTYTTPEGRFKFWEPLPAEQILLYVWDLKGARFEGRPFTRPMYGAWLRKEFKQKMSAVLAQKLGAPVPIVQYPKGFPMDKIGALDTLAQGLRGTNAAETYALLPMGDDNTPVDVQFAGAEHNIDRGFTDIIDSENREIAHAGGNTTSNLGETESGSRALGESKGAMEMELVEAVATILGDMETHGAIVNLPGAIEELVDWNFGDVRAYPTLVCSKVNKGAIAQLFTQTIEAWKNGIIPKTPEARRQIVEGNLGLNLPEDQYDVKIPEQLLPNPVGPSAPDAGDGTPPNDAPDGEGGTEHNLSLESLSTFRKKIASLLEPMEDAPKGGKFRARNRLEAEVVDLAAVSHAFRVGERDTLTELRFIHRRMIDELMARLRAGKITLRNIESQRRSVFKGKGKAKRDLVRVFERSGAAGWGAVQDELERQQEVSA